MAGCILIHASFDAFVEFTGPKPFRGKTNSSSLHISKHTCSIYLFHTHTRKICILQHNYQCDRCDTYDAKLVSVKIAGFTKIVCCVHAWYGLKGLQGECGCAVMKCSECIEHYTHIKPSPAAFYFIATAQSTDLSMTLHKTVTFDLLSGNDQGDK